MPVSFEGVGHIAHFNLRPEVMPFKHLIGQVVLDKNPAIKTVINKVGRLKGGGVAIIEMMEAWGVVIDATLMLCGVRVLGGGSWGGGLWVIYITLNLPGCQVNLSKPLFD